MSNRKYITSTGVLLKSLNSDEIAAQGAGIMNKNNGVNPYQQYPNPQNHQQQQFLSPYMNNSLLNTQPNQFDVFHQQMSQNSMMPLHDVQPIMQPMPAQSRWPQATKGPGKISSKPNSQQQQQHPYYNSYNQQSTSKPSNYNKQPSGRKNTASNNNSSSVSSTSAISELPETFGLPSNSALKTANSNSVSNKAPIRAKVELLPEDMSSESSKTLTDNAVIKIISPPSKPTTIDQDVEIISEKTSFSKPNEDQVFKSYLLKAYGSGPVLISSKPQSNFTSNLACINQLMKKSGIEFFDNKIRRCHPYSSIKPKIILSLDEEETEAGENLEYGEKNGSKSDRIRSQKVIVIDDDNQFNSHSSSDTLLHKPWINPELIKLIKNRNQLQEKLSEADHSRGATENEELLKKYRNIRNKVTKLVKKARKDYLNKYMGEGAREESSYKDTDNKTSSVSLISTHTTTTTKTTTSSTTLLAATQSESDMSKISTSNQTVNEILASKSFSSLGGSFLKDQTAIMNNLYSTYYNDYLKQYNKQQEELAKARSDEQEGSADYEKLQKQASVYAEQQRAIQKQLENTLKQAAEQLIHEIAEAATARSNHPQHKPPQSAQQASSMNSLSSNLGLGSSQYQPVTHQSNFHLHHSLYSNPNLLMPMVVPSSTNPPASANQPLTQKIYYK